VKEMRNKSTASHLIAPCVCVAKTFGHRMCRLSSRTSSDGGSIWPSSYHSQFTDCIPDPFFAIKISLVYFQ